MELRAEQEAALKEALREVERERARERLGAGAGGGTDIQYLKNVVLKLYETGEAAALLPVVGMMLRFSPAELRRCQDALAASEAAAPGEPAPPGGAPAGGGAAGAPADGADYGLLTGWTSWASGGAEEARPGAG